MPKMVTTPSKPVNFSNFLFPWLTDQSWAEAREGLDRSELEVSAHIMSASQQLLASSFGSHESFKIEVDNRIIT